jgi:alpha-D-ribose 1-methylphosphonate 5-triphosphate synthase subunit PhnG
VTRKRRTRVLVLGDPDLRKSLADEVRACCAVEEITPARVGLVLVTVRESARRSLFHLGEVLVSEAKVRVSGTPGLGLVRGRDLEAAVDLAVVDAACSAKLPLTDSWSERLEKAEADLEANLNREQVVLSRTRVEFETLDSGVPREV